MKLDKTRICTKCKEIYDHIKALKSGVPIRVCPSCGGTDTVMLSTYIETIAEHKANGNLCGVSV